MKGALSFGRYRVQRRIAVGGMAEVFLASERLGSGSERSVVIKRMRPELARDRELVSQFLAEAQISARLDHSNIARVYEVGRLGESPFIALEYVPGFDLGIVLAHFRREATAIPIGLSLRVIVDVCEGLVYAHGATDESGQPLAIVHRDISPSNILLSEDGSAKLCDFGIATTGSARVNNAALQGKATYMAPEHVLGKELDQRGDVFSVAVVLYEMLAGRHPFKSDSDFVTLKNIVEADAPPLGGEGVLRDIERILGRALAKSPEGRHATVDLLLEDLHDAAARWEIVLSHGDVARHLQVQREVYARLSRELLGAGEISDLAEGDWTGVLLQSRDEPDERDLPEVMLITSRDQKILGEARRLYAQAQFERAIALLEGLVRSRPPPAIGGLAHFLIGVNHMAMGVARAALDAFTAALRANPDFLPPHDAFESHKVVFEDVRSGFIVRPVLQERSATVASGDVDFHLHFSTSQRLPKDYRATYLYRVSNGVRFDRLELHIRERDLFGVLPASLLMQTDSIDYYVEVESRMHGRVASLGWVSAPRTLRIVRSARQWQWGARK